MTFRSTVCAFAVMAGATLGGCELERTQQPADTSPVENVAPAPEAEGESGEQAAASTGFGIHVGSFEPEEAMTASWDPDPEGFRPIVYYNPEPFITAEHVRSFYDTVTSNGDPAVGFRLNDEGSALMRKTTSARINKPVVMTLDGNVLSAPIVNSTISRNGIAMGPSDAAWIDAFKVALAAAGAMDRKEIFEPQAPPPPEMTGIGVWVASTQRSDFFFIEAPILEGTTVYANDKPLLVVDHFARATRTTDEDGNPALRLELNEAGKAVMAECADIYLGNYLSPSWQGRPINLFQVTGVIDDAIIVSDAGIDPDLAENWMAALDASLSE